MFRKYVMPAALVLILSTSITSKSHAFIAKIKDVLSGGKTGTQNVYNALKEFDALTFMQSTLGEVNKLNSTIGVVAGDINNQEYIKTEKLRESLEAWHKEIKDLIEEAQNTIQLEIGSLELHVNHNQFMLTQAKVALEAMETEASDFKIAADAISVVSIGRLKGSKEVARKIDESNASGQIKAITAYEKELNKYEKLIKIQLDNLKNITKNPSFSKKFEPIQNKIKKTREQLLDIQKNTEKAMQKKVVKPFSAEAENVMNRLANTIAGSNCPLIKSVANISQKNIDLCKAQKVKIINSQGKDKLCKKENITIYSKSSAIQACRDTLNLKLLAK